VCRNPFRSIVVRAIELVFACDEALRLVESYEPPGSTGREVVAGPAWARARPRRHAGCCCTSTSSTTTGIICRARIMPPTSQNQLTIEDDLRRVVEGGSR
jgi:sulfhydrogenase subunit alpha